jgi:heme exporter protein D
MDWSNFFSMGGYGFYVWGSYIFAVLAIGGELLGLNRRKKALAQQAKRAERKPAAVITGSVRNETTT